MFTGIAVTGLVVFIRGDIVARRKLRREAAAAAETQATPEAETPVDAAPASVDQQP